MHAPYQIDDWYGKVGSKLKTGWILYDMDKQSWSTVLDKNLENTIIYRSDNCGPQQLAVQVDFLPPTTPVVAPWMAKMQNYDKCVIRIRKKYRTILNVIWMGQDAY